MLLVTNFLVFQLGWLACVLGGAHHLPWTGTGVAAVAVAWHLSQAATPRRELALVLLVGLLGALWDSLLVAAGLLVYPSGTLLPGTAPHWIVAMWLLFATTLNVSLRWLRQRPVLAIACGALGGPLAYYAGAQLGGVQMPQPGAALAALSVGWAVFMPLLSVLAQRFDGMQARLAAPLAAVRGRLT
jgi:hypothetical protein